MRQPEDVGNGGDEAYYGDGEHDRAEHQTHLAVPYVTVSNVDCGK
jgi:hypothetical protein